MDNMCVLCGVCVCVVGVCEREKEKGGESIISCMYFLRNEWSSPSHCCFCPWGCSLESGPGFLA